MENGEKKAEDCPFYKEDLLSEGCTGPGRDAFYPGNDVSGRPYDFVLGPIGSEPSARKIILPFRSDLVERWNIVAGDIVLGRPMGAGCPIQHILRVIDANPVTGVLTCHTIGPRAAREGTLKEIQAYHVIGFEGLATVVGKPPAFGLRQPFLPSFCMMDTAHTGFVCMVLGTAEGQQVRVEDIRIL